MKNNSESIFQTIGDYPVVDQFDILYTGLLSGSYVDNYVTGSLISKFKLSGQKKDQYITVFGNRGLAFSKLGINRNKFPGNNTSYELQSWGERSGFVRNIRIFSSSERYKDSQIPKIESLVEALGGKIEQLAATSLIAIGISGSSGNTSIGFHESFPFEGKFSEIQRIQKIETFIKDKPVSIGEEGISYSGIWLNSSSDYLKENDIGRILFGFGDRRKIAKTSPTVGQNNLPEIRKIASLFTGLAFIGPIIRGWKYGLVNAMPYYTSVVFRRDRYGQMRDMLEQRPTIVSSFDPKRSPSNYFGDTEEPPISITPSLPPGNPSSPIPGIPQEIGETAYKSVVEVSFVRQTIKNNEIVYVNAEPSTTFSSNLSTYATSSLPFFDRTLTVNVPEANTGYWQEISLLPDVFNNQIIGEINRGGTNVGG